MSEWYGVRPPVVQEPAPPVPDAPDTKDSEGVNAPSEDAPADE